jgi:hypothetical protein
MSTVTLRPFGSGPLRDRANAPTSAQPEQGLQLPAFWGSLFNHEPTAAANDPAPQARKSSALVGDLWIQIR